MSDVNFSSRYAISKEELEQAQFEDELISNLLIRMLREAIEQGVDLKHLKIETYIDSRPPVPLMFAELRGKIKEDDNG